ncbi:hypothetical protein [Pantoea stewartii]|uniref:hypothetical protein n=1 Tax=Pantoea stewartii TaxID=66269 RepID=UPI00198032C9|nr:hypothetical protein [Pantoea stewartii]
MNERGRYFLVSRFPTDSKPMQIGFRRTGNEKVPDDYLAFRLDVDRTVRTINAVFEGNETARIEMYEQVFQASMVCFSGEKEDFSSAAQALLEIKKEVLESSWIFVRNKIMVVYGLFSLLLIAALTVAQYYFYKELHNLPAVLIGTCLGSWLFVSIKTSSISFDEIYENICQHRSILLRLIYSCLLSLAASICLMAGFIEVKIGGISTAMISNNIFIALATGIFFGLGESSLASSLSSKVKNTLSSSGE